MILLILFSAAINFYVDPVVYRIATESYQKQLSELSAKLAAEKEVLDSLRSTGPDSARIADVETQIRADQELLDLHARLQNLMVQDGYYYIEFECEISYQEFNYREINNKIIADFYIIFKLVNQSRSDSLIDTIDYQYSINSYSEAVKTEPSFLEQFGMLIPAGNFDYNVEVISGTNHGQRSGSVVIKREDYAVMSDLLIASNITADTTGGYFNKGALKVIPHPSKNFNYQYANLYVYYELYDLKPDSSSAKAMYELVNTEGKVIRRASQRMAKVARFQSANFGISTLGMNPGIYSFRVTVNDTIAGIVAQRSIPVSIESKIQTEMTFEGSPYFDEIEYFLTANEYKRFMLLANKDKGVYLKKFWRQMDYPVIAQRFEYADSNFQQGKIPGHETDRGRIYVKFGPPDEIQKNSIEMQESRPYEQWIYYNGIQFIFVDVRGSAEYVLVWTNARSEKSQPMLYSYLPKSMQGQIENEKAPSLDE